MKKILSLMMTLILMMGVFFSFGENVFAAADVPAGYDIDHAINLNYGYARCNLSSSITERWFKFAPNSSDNYRFYSESSVDTYGYFYSGYWNAREGTVASQDDDSGSGNNFQITQYLSSGTTYYFKVRMYRVGTAGDFDVFLEKQSAYNYDSTAPTASISSRNNISSIQTLDLKMSDSSSGVAGYYLGNNEDYTKNKYYPLNWYRVDSSTQAKSPSISVTVDVTGRQYLAVRDRAGNIVHSQSCYVSLGRLTLNANDGTDSNDKILVQNGYSITLPTPTRSNYIFMGWADSTSATSGRTGSFTVNGTPTKYAIWKAGLKTTIDINYSGKVVSTYFTPPESGVYDIYSTGNYDTDAYIYMPDGSSYYNDQSGEIDNFLLKKYLTAGQKYEIQAKMYYTSSTGSFPLVIEKSICEHDYVYQSMVSPTCTKKGYQIYECQICNYKNNTNYVNAYGHSNYTTTTKATTSKNGAVVTKCSACGYVSKSTAIYYPKTVTLSATSYTYNGKVKKPTVTVKDSAGKVISASNYTVTYPKGRKAIGTYTVTVTFKGNYSGTVKKTFTIKPKASSISSLKTPSKGKVKINWKKVSGVTGYQIQISKKSNFKSGVKTISCKSGKTSTTGKLTSKKKYYFRIRTYKTVKVNGKSTKIYSSWSKSKSIKVK